MPSPRTECTELAVAFGLLQADPTGVAYAGVSPRFEGTLSPAAFAAFRQAFAALHPISGPLFRLGRELTDRYPELFPPGAHVRWLGPLKQSGTVTVAQDLVIGTTAVSVKENSRIVYNLSPYNLCESIPGGRVLAQKTDNWFLHTAPAEYAALFALVAPRLARRGARYDSVTEFEARAKPAEREWLQAEVAALTDGEAAAFADRYRLMCHATAMAAAGRFNRNLDQTLATPHAEGVRDLILKYFLRLGDTRYVLAGLDRGQPFALLAPSITEWKRQWELRTVEAAADTAAGQSRVDFLVTLKQKPGAGVVRLPFHAEIRWSHGKFCGNPEGKLYRDFDSWGDAPGVTVLV